MGCGYMQEYRSGHNEAVLKTVCPKGTGVRIPLPAPKNKDTPCEWPLFFATVRDSRTPLCDSSSSRMGFAYPTRRSKSSRFRRRVWVSSSKTNTPLPSLPYKLEFDELFSAYYYVCIVGFNYFYNRHCGFTDNRYYIVEIIGVHLDFASSHINIFALVFING